MTASAPTRPIGLFGEYTLNAGAVNEAIGLARDLARALPAPGELQSEFAGGSPRTASNSFATDQLPNGRLQPTARTLRSQRAGRRVNVGAFIFAALLLDGVLWLLVLLGWESVAIPANFASTHQPEFVFPFSHGWLASIARSALAGAGATKVGLGLWQDMPVALAVEGFIMVVGLCLFVPGASLSRAKKVWLTVLSLLTLAITVAGMTVAPPPPSLMAMVVSSLVTIGVVCALAGWLGRVGNERRA